MSQRRLAKIKEAVAVIAAIATLLLVSCRPQSSLRPVVLGEGPASKTAAYLVARGSYLSPGAALALDYPRRKFDLEWAKPLVDAVLAKVSDPSEFAEVGVFSRMIDPSEAVRLKPSITQTVEGFSDVPTSYAVLRGLYCDWTPPPSEFLAFLTKPRPEVRHWRLSSLMALGYLEENECITPEVAGALGDALKRNYAEFLDSAVDSRSWPGGEFVETVGGLYFALGASYVAPEWARYVIEHQQPDGTWQASSSVSGDEDLTAVWGLLSILEYTQAQSVPVPLIAPHS